VTLRYRQMARSRGRLVPRVVPRRSIMLEHRNKFRRLAAALEPPIGIEPMIYALREARHVAPRTLPAQMASRPSQHGPCAQNDTCAQKAPAPRSTTRSTTSASLLVTECYWDGP